MAPVRLLNRGVLKWKNLGNVRNLTKWLCRRKGPRLVAKWHFEDYAGCWKFVGREAITKSIWKFLSLNSVGPWWWNSGQCSGFMLRWSEFNSCWLLNFSVCTVLRKDENKWKREQEWSIFLKKSSNSVWDSVLPRCFHAATNCTKYGLKEKNLHYLKASKQS